VSARRDGTLSIARAVRREQAALARSLSQLRRLAPREVHQVRVHCRRLRSFLKTFRRLFDPEAGSDYRQALKTLAHVLAGLRELDVLRGDAAQLHQAGMAAALDHARADTARRVQRRLRGAGMANTVRTVLGVRGTAVLGLRSDVTAVEVLALVRRQCRRVHRLAAAAPQRPDALPELRIAVTNIRYANESIDQFDTKKDLEFVAQLRLAQKRLGEHRDVRVARDWLHTGAPGLPESDVHVADEVLAARERSLRRGAGRAVHDVEQCCREWLSAGRAGSIRRRAPAGRAAP